MCFYTARELKVFMKENRKANEPYNYTPKVPILNDEPIKPSTINIIHETENV